MYMVWSCQDPQTRQRPGVIPTSTKRNKYVFLVVDRFTTWSIMIPTPDCTATTAAQALYKHWICVLGCPTTVITDNESHFTIPQFSDAAEKVGYRVKHTTPYHPQSNGMAERRFRELGKALRIYSETLNTWEDVIPEALLTSQDCELYNWVFTRTTVNRPTASFTTRF